MAKGLIINSFVFDMADHLDDTEIAEFWGVLAAYYRGDALPEMSKPVAMAFQRVADDNQKFDPEHRQSISEMRSEIGKKGAAAKWGVDGKQWQTMANDGKTPLVMANEANHHKEKNIDIDKEKDIEKISVFEERGGAGEEETKNILSDKALNEFLSGAKRQGMSREEALRCVENMGLLYKESPQT